MGVKQIEQDRPKGRWRLYLITSISLLLTVLLAVAVVYFWEEIQDAQAYGYAGGFIISVLGGITVIPAPSLIVVFTLGGVLFPPFVGLISGFGEALGGITIYLTGAGMETIWSRFRTKGQTFERRLGLGDDITRPGQSRFWSKGEVFYNRLVKRIGGHEGALVVFVVAAMPLSPFYFAGLAAGSLRMGLLRFFLLSWAGKTIKGLTVAFAGYGGLYFVLKWMGG